MCSKKGQDPTCSPTTTRTILLSLESFPPRSLCRARTETRDDFSTPRSNQCTHTICSYTVSSICDTCFQSWTLQASIPIAYLVDNRKLPYAAMSCRLTCIYQVGTRSHDRTVCGETQVMQHPARFVAVNSERDAKMHLSAKGTVTDRPGNQFMIACFKRTWLMILDKKDLTYRKFEWYSCIIILDVD